MRKLVSTCAAGLTAAALVLVPLAAPAQAAAPAKHYTITVTGDGRGDIVVLSAAAKGKTISDPSVTVKAAAHLPFHKKLSSKSALIEVVATHKHGAKIGCTITNPAGKVVSRSTGYGAHGIAICLVAKDSLASGLAGLGSGTPAS